MARVRGWRWIYWVCLLCAATAISSQAQITFTTLVTFNQTNGEEPDNLALIQGVDGNFYGTTYYGGDVCGFSGCGTIFKVTTSGTLTTLYQFCAQTGCPDGSRPLGTLVLATNGDFYGVTNENGGISCSGGCGTIFKMTPEGTLSTLHTFCVLAKCPDGNAPAGGLVQATNGNFYGTTRFGNKLNNTGTVFEITPAGKLTTLYSFCSVRPQCADGSQPQGTLIQASDGNVYGETEKGGTFNYGTIFKITPKGQLTTLYSFKATDGDDPSGGLIQAADGNFYGVTAAGGSGYYCISNSGDGCGTVFEITPAGTLTTLHDFCTDTCTDGAFPYGPLVQATDGNLYGETFGYSSGPADVGTIFAISTVGTLSTVFTFGPRGDGYGPTGGLLEATNGTFYGTTSAGDGTVFSLSTGLGPFVKVEPTSAKEGATIGIFGQGFSSSSIVRFGGVRAKDAKVSGTGLSFAGATFITAKVPAGALTGSVTVTTDGTTLTSNQPFLVTPQLLSFSPPGGSVGTQVTITGSGFTQTSEVDFGGDVPAQFTVNSDKQVTATVPAGAQTGPIGVVTKGGTAVSSATFTVD
ncbi:MAG: choice-of-anchor tandem repeat GloVer-containing protein [Candidatus Sulfotelmatobacter sp.]